MYQSLYRKYRPKTFDEVVGQDIIIKTLKNEIKKDKLNHAYIFSGPRGTGKTSTAKILAKTINCLNLINLTPCDKCVNCTQYNNKQNIDIIEIDAASNNGVDEIRELRNNVNLVPSTGKYKIYIIDEVHMLTIGAWNALLKTLEEPPSHVIFVLATTEIHKIPSTILSRCQKFDFQKISVDNIKKRLKEIIKAEKIDINEDAITEIARLADGGMRDSLSILEQVVSYSDKNITVEMVHEINGSIPQTELKNFINNIIEKDYNKIFNKLDEYDNNGKNFIKLSEEIINFYRNILLYLNAKEYLKQTVSYYELYSDLANIISEETIVNNIKSFNEIIPEMKKSNNPKLIFETVIIKILNMNNKRVENINIEKKQNIIEQPKTEKKYNIKEMVNIKNIEEIKNIRINNALCDFNKKKYLEFKNKIDDIRIMLMNPDYSELTSLVLDGEIKAFGNNIIIIVYKNNHLSKLFNNQIIELSKLFKEVYNENIKLISTTTDEWNKIKDEFNNKKKKYEYIEEPEIKIDKKNIDNEFSDIIEYV